MVYLIPYGEVYVLTGLQLKDRTTGQFKVAPTLAAGDFKIEKDGGAAANLATLPTVAWGPRVGQGSRRCRCSTWR